MMRGSNLAGIFGATVGTIYTTRTHCSVTQPLSSLLGDDTSPLSRMKAAAALMDAAGAANLVSLRGSSVHGFPVVNHVHFRFLHVYMTAQVRCGGMARDFKVILIAARVCIPCIFMPF